MLQKSYAASCIMSQENTCYEESCCLNKIANDYHRVNHHTKRVETIFNKCQKLYSGYYKLLKHLHICTKITLSVYT